MAKEYKISKIIVGIEEESPKADIIETNKNSLENRREEEEKSSKNRGEERKKKEEECLVTI